MPESFVSLFTREWIEMESREQKDGLHLSPSLRGSGLKYKRRLQILCNHTSPSLRGSGLKSEVATENE